MNIFFTDSDPVIAAQNQCDKLLNKMILEQAQMLSTAHRILDGKKQVVIKNNRKKTVWTHSDNLLENSLYLATHYNHPSSVWLRETSENYQWGYQHFHAMCKEYTFRCGKVHACEKLLNEKLSNNPRGIKVAKITEFVKCMGASPESLAINNPVEAYKHFYQTKQTRFKMVWTKRSIPSWFKNTQ